jgi:hypothetical protein
MVSASESHSLSVVAAAALPVVVAAPLAPELAPFDDLLIDFIVIELFELSDDCCSSFSSRIVFVWFEFAFVLVLPVMLLFTAAVLLLFSVAVDDVVLLLPISMSVFEAASCSFKFRVCEI